jgi:adenylate cyclase
MDIAGAVEPSLREAEIDRSWRKPTESLDAYDLYLRARSAFRDSSVEKLRAAFDLVQRALDQDPHFARALALQAECLLHLCTAGAVSPEEVIPRGLRLAEAALTSAGDDEEALSTAAVVIAFMGGNIETALSASQRALMVNPNARALSDNGQIQFLAGNPRAAIESFTRALRLSPRDLYRGYTEMGLAVAHRDLGRPDEALIWGRRAVLSLPLFAGAYRAAAAAMVDLGRIEEARELISQLLKIHPKASIRLEWVRRGFRNQDSAESWIAALRSAGLPD